MTKRRNRICRRIAVALTVTLLVGQSHAFVLAEEGAGDTQSQTEASSGEIGTDTPGSGNAMDGGNTGNIGNGIEQDDEDGQNKCVCGTKCVEGAVNTDCPVCAADYAACAGKADDRENDDTENSDLENGGQDNTNDNLEGTTDEPDKCVCETACTEGTVNEDCPVCAADYANCAKNAGEKVTPAEEAVLTATLEDGPSEDEGIATLADEEITYEGIKYVVTSDGKIIVGRQDQAVISGDIEIPEEFDYEKDGITYHYRVTGIGEWAFYNCRDLTGITIPGSVTSIEERAFQDCSGLTGITIPDGVESIESMTFQGCSGLTNVTIPDSVTSIKCYAFYDCSGLTGITIPDSVTSIEYNAFWRCHGLTSITIPDGITSLADGIFMDCTALTSVTIPDSVVSIGGGAFYGCSSLTSITIPDSVKSMGVCVFQNCTGLISIKLPKDVKRIEFSAFEGCSALTSIFIPENMLLLGGHAFWGCENLKDLYIVVLSGGSNLLPREAAQNPFDSLPDEEHKRNIHFVNANGIELTGQLYDDAFDYAAAHDNDPADGKWYGWSYNGLKNDGDIPNPNPKPNPDGDNPGGNGGFGDDTGDNDRGGGSSGGMEDHSKLDSDSTETERIAVVSEASAPQVEKAVVADTGTTQSPGGQTASTGETAAGGKEPKTGDTAYWEVYATLAMVAGLTYLLLYIMEESRGMSEREKEAAVAALIRWGKKGGSFRKCCAMAAIFGLLMYYHTIGKRVGQSAFRDRYLGQAS